VLERRREIVRRTVGALAEERFHSDRLLEQGPPPSGAGVAAIQLAPKLGRNDPCRCGSGKKFKRCCGATARPGAP
jgi:uncharacterized protein YecA (UPF0149 family)